MFDFCLLMYVLINENYMIESINVWEIICELKCSLN